MINRLRDHESKGKQKKSKTMPLHLLNNVNDGSYEIISSSVFNIYSEELRFKLLDLNFIFSIPRNTAENNAPLISHSYESATKTTRVNLQNFRNVFGASTPQPVHILNNVITGGGSPKRLYFSAKVNALSNDANSPLQVVITFYVQDMPVATPPPMA